MVISFSYLFKFGLLFGFIGFLIGVIASVFMMTKLKKIKLTLNPLKWFKK